MEMKRVYRSEYVMFDSMDEVKNNGIRGSKFAQFLESCACVLEHELEK
jgi:hypothetical protein